jgi:hypothetical protein
MALSREKRLAAAAKASSSLEVMLHRRLHGAEGVGDAQVREGRIDHGALAPPALAVGDEDRVADQRLEGIDHQVALGKETVGIAQDVAHQLRIVEQHGGAPRVAEIADGKAIGGGGQQFEEVAVSVPEHAGKGRQGREGMRLGRYVGVGFAGCSWAVHGALMRCKYPGR